MQFRHWLSATVGAEVPRLLDQAAFGILELQQNLPKRCVAKVLQVPAALFRVHECLAQAKAEALAWPLRGPAQQPSVSDPAQSARV